MGNFTSSSCFHISPPKPKTAKLIDSNGNLIQIKLPVKSAELMLENPGFFLSLFDDLRRTGRLIALGAEDELFPDKIYLFVPLSRVNRKISDSDLGIIEAVTVRNSRKKRKRGESNNKVLPAVEVEEKVGGESEVLEKDTGFSGDRLEKYGQWTPGLDPISEELEEL